MPSTYDGCDQHCLRFVAESMPMKSKRREAWGNQNPQTSVINLENVRPNLSNLFWCTSNVQKVVLDLEILPERDEN